MGCGSSTSNQSIVTPTPIPADSTAAKAAQAHNVQIEKTQSSGSDEMKRTPSLSASYPPATKVADQDQRASRFDLFESPRESPSNSRAGSPKSGYRNRQKPQLIDRTLSKGNLMATDPALGSTVADANGNHSSHFVSLPKNLVYRPPPGSRLSLRITGILPAFVAEVAEGANLEHLLSEAFAAIEHLFHKLDRDEAGLLTFRMFQTQLALKGFDDLDHLLEVCQKLDVNDDGCIDFSEFLCIMYLWSSQAGTFETIFEHRNNCDVVGRAFLALEEAWKEFDENGNLYFCYKDLTGFMMKKVPDIWESSKTVIDEIFPVSAREAGDELNFQRFMHLLYACLCRQSFSRIPGKFKDSDIGLEKEVVYQGANKESVREKSSCWRSLLAAFLVWETDFQRFDKSGDGRIDYSELTNSVPQNEGLDRLDILTRLEYKFKTVDQDGTYTVDFFEFGYLVVMMTQDGSYGDLVGNSTGKPAVYKASVLLSTRFRELDTRKIQKLELEQVHEFCQHNFGEIPTELDELFKRIATPSLALEGSLVVDIGKFLKLMYNLVRYDGPYVLEKYHPSRPDKNMNSFLISIPYHRKIDLPDSIDPVIVKNFKSLQLLGKGSQGVVHLGTYSGRKVAGKTLHGKMTKELQEDIENEVKLMRLMRHPNCHCLIGAKTTPGEGGALILTEVCDEGSLFDVYAKKRKVFDEQTALRLSKEIALALEYLHTMGYMHRDVKSLNIFMASEYVPKLADFGFATLDPKRDDACGTVQWMAPEVMVNFITEDKQKYGRECDIYSYGVLIWEIWHCRCPYADYNLNQMQIAYKIFKEKIRPTMSKRVNEEARKIIARCWAEDPASRPTFQQIVKVWENFKIEI